MLVRGVTQALASINSRKICLIQQSEFRIFERMVEKYLARIVFPRPSERSIYLCTVAARSRCGSAMIITRESTM